VSVLLQPASHREGLGLGRKASPPDALIIAPPRDIPVPLLHLDPALNAMAAKALARNSHVSKIAYLLDLSGAVGVDAEQGFPPAPDSGVAAEVTAAIHLQVARDHLDVGVADREQGIEVVAAEGVSSSVERSWDVHEGFVGPKTARGRRTVPIAAVLRGFLIEHKLRSGRSEELVFGNDEFSRRQRERAARGNETKGRTA